MALGKQLEKNNSDYSLNKDVLTKQKCNSTKGVGKWQPTDFTIVDNIKIPNGKLGKVKPNVILNYNEHIIYDVNQQLIRYLLIVKNIGGYGGY